MKRVIITGADGFVGSYTVQCFLDNGMEVLALDIIEEPRRLKPRAGLSYKCIDVSNPKQLLDAVESDYYDTFVHFAWAGSAGSQRTDYNLQMQNALNTVECMKTAKQLGCSRFVCAGSIMEREVEAAVHEQESRPGMGYIYGMGKLIAHCLCKSVASNIGIDLLWPMITNAYGVGELSPRFVNTTLRKIINNEPLQFTAGTQNYDFVYVTDVAKAFFAVAKDGIPFKEYIIGSGNARPLKEFILEMQRALAPDATPLFGDVPFTGTNMPLSAFDTTDIKTDCSFEPEVGFAEGTRLTMEWLKTL
ncbi:MAG: NAD(P)-dependent oxidoreductase [Muribaculaceae bacterium]|nr:NAD(P)-dependent oxidoreductase [Muribaculaceae bacterium]